MKHRRIERLGLCILGGVLGSLWMAPGTAHSVSGTEVSVHPVIVGITARAADGAAPVDSAPASETPAGGESASAASDGSTSEGDARDRATKHGFASLELSFPGPDRPHLELSPELWEAIRRQVGAGAGAGGERVGYSAATMARYGRSTHLLPGVLSLFADVRTVSRETGRWSDQLLADARKCAAFGYGWEEGGIGEMVRRCYGLLGVSTGRRTMGAIDSTWTGDHPPFPIPTEREAQWQAVPRGVRDLIVRLYEGARVAGPWVRQALGPAELTGTLTVDSLYDLAMAHRDDEAFGQMATLRGEYLDLFSHLDLGYLGYATILWARYLESALADYAAPGTTTTSSSGERATTFRLTTELGEILIGGPGDDDHQQPAFLVVDIGGNDTYGPGFAASNSLASPVACLVDLAGDDEYRAGDSNEDEANEDESNEDRPYANDPGAHDQPTARRPATVSSFGAGIFGIGALIDLAGNDSYAVHESGLGRGCFGSGLLFDFAGDDTYHGGRRWTQGAAHGGIGVLCDLAGEDRYSCAQQSQGLGATLGAGLLLDLAGDDRYIARDDGNISELYLGQSVAMSQGCGYGRRADLGDGHSLAGGFGLLIDGAGNDDYHAQVWSQGCGYWWGVGVLEDRAGNDTYRNGKYSSGAAAHFAIGVHVDLAGNDRYNQGNDTAKNQFQGHARDGSIGIFIDGDGDDRYDLRSHCAGSGDLGSVGLFWDRRGDDHYRYDPADLGDSGWSRTPPLGSTTEYPPFRSFRDEVPVYGIFLDTGGRDEYETGIVGHNDDRWSMQRYPGAWGLGMDWEIFPAD